MKRLISIIALAAVAASVMLLAGLSIAGCNQNSARQTPAPVETPLAEPTEAPNPIEAARPTFDNGADLGIAAEFPTFAPLGKLTDGPIMPEEAKYFVLYGESNLLYIYDRYGESVMTAQAPTYESLGIPTGHFYGEHGICYGFSFDKMAGIEDYVRVGDIWMKLDKKDRIVEVCDAYFKSILPIKGEGISVGNSGGIVRMDENYLVIDLSVDRYMKTYTYNSPMKLLNADGEEIDAIDPSPFGLVRGVFADKYIIGSSGLQTNLYSLQGEKVLEQVRPIEEIGPDFVDTGADRLYATNYIYDRNDKIRDKELKQIKQADAFQSFTAEYAAISTNEYTIPRSYIYAGVADADGNWLFRIYQPHFASDGRPRHRR